MPSFGQSYCVPRLECARKLIRFILHLIWLTRACKFSEIDLVIQSFSNVKEERLQTVQKKMLLSYEANSRVWEMGIIAVCFYGFYYASSLLKQSKYPLVGVKSKWEAGMVSNFRFYQNAQAVLLDGYSKVRILASITISSTHRTTVQRAGLPLHARRLRHARPSSKACQRASDVTKQHRKPYGGPRAQLDGKAYEYEYYPAEQSSLSDPPIEIDAQPQQLDRTYARRAKLCPASGNANSRR